MGQVAYGLGLVHMYDVRGGRGLQTKGKGGTGVPVAQACMYTHLGLRPGATQVLDLVFEALHRVPKGQQLLAVPRPATAIP
jgi:hypothetical protein